MYKLVIYKAALISRIILQDIIYKTPLGTTIEPPLMGSLSRRRRPISIKYQRNSSLQPASVCRGTIVFEKLLHMPFLAFPNALFFSKSFHNFSQKSFVCVLEGDPINLVYKRKHKLKR